MDKFYFLKKGETFLVFLIFAGAFLVRLYILLNSDNYEGTAVGRATVAMDILRHPGFMANFDPAFAPLHLYLVAGALCILKDPMFTPQLVSFIFGSLLIFPFYHYVRLSFNRETAIFSSLIVCLYPLHVFHSVISTAPVTFHFFLFSSLYFFFKFKKQPSDKVAFLVLSAVFLNLACMIRYEGWVFIPLLSLLLYNNKKRHIVSFLLISMILPLVLMYLNYIRSNDPLFFLHQSDQHSRFMINFWRKSGLKWYLFNPLIAWPRILCETLNPYVVITGFCGLAYCLCKKKYLHPTIIFLTLFLIFEYKAVRQTLIFDTKYSLTLGLLLIPFCFLLLADITRIFRKKILKTAALVIFVLFVAYISIRNPYIKGPIAPTFVKEISSYLGKQATSDDRILIDYDGDEDNVYVIVLYSLLDSKQFLIVPRKIESERKYADEKQVLNYLMEEKPRFVLYSPKGYLPEIFHFSLNRKREEEYGFIFDLVYERGAYRIYEVIPKDETRYFYGTYK